MSKKESPLDKVYKTAGRAENVARALGTNYKVARGADGLGFRIIKAGVADTKVEKPTEKEVLELPTKAATKGSVMPDAYRKKYGKVDMCGDDLANEFMCQVMDARGKLSLDALVKTGNGNSIDVEGRWGHLNPGMQRMNLGNMLRKLLKAHFPVYLVSVEGRVVVLWLNKKGEVERETFKGIREAKSAMVQQAGNGRIPQPTKDFEDTRKAPVNEANKKRQARRALKEAEEGGKGA